MTLRPRTTILAALCVAGAAAAAGCATSASPASRPQTSELQYDPCAFRLHDLCGQFLLYYYRYHALPARLADLPAVDGIRVPLVCPTSHRPYVYAPQGLPVPGRPGRLIVYDPTPCHADGRWGILAEVPRPGKPVIFRVIRPPESLFTKK